MPTFIYDTITIVPENYFKTEPIFPPVQVYMPTCNVEGLLSWILCFCDTIILLLSDELTCPMTSQASRQEGISR